MAIKLSIRYKNPFAGLFALNSKYDLGNSVITPKKSISPTSSCVIILTIINSYPFQRTAFTAGLCPAMLLCQPYKQGVVFIEHSGILL